MSKSNTVIQTRAGEELYGKILRAAKRRGLDLSSLTRMAVIDWLDRNEPCDADR